MYDPNRTAKLYLVIYSNGILTYSLAVCNKKVGAVINCVDSTRMFLGDTRFLRDIVIGYNICSIEISASQGAKLLRSGLCSGKVLNKTPTYCVLRIKSNKFFRINSICYGTIGTLSIAKNNLNKEFKYAKFNIFRGRRPCVRGVAKNPIDHPHGGGQGKTSGGRPSVTP
jgi:large subunit ribosomal protein L2